MIKYWKNAFENAKYASTFTKKLATFVTFYTLRFLRYSMGMTIKVKVTTTNSKVKSRSHHGDAHIIPRNNTPTNINFYTLRFLRYSNTRFSNSRSLWQSQRSNYCQTMTLHVNIHHPMSLPIININFPRYTPKNSKIKGQITVKP